IESAADADELGLLTAAGSLGYRMALFCTEAAILILALKVGWASAYGVFAAAMAVGVAATLLAREPARADAALADLSSSEQAHPLRAAWDAVAGPFVAFFLRHGLAAGALMLAMITLYHLCDYMRGPMVNPYYAALGIPKTTIAAVRAAISLPASLAGIALGGLVSARIGVLRTLVLGALLQPFAVAAFAVLGWHGGDFDLGAMGPLHITAFEAVMAFDSVAMSLSGVALVAYMSSLTSLGYTATQFALLTSAMVWSGKTLKAFSGVIVEALQPGRSLLDAYALFYLLSGAVGLPAIVVCMVLAARQARAARLTPVPA
ncbi:MAG TPA: MFS transporter, partial [Caulobacteraceae bacterium]|nr:MFS transporter [Caulobacteraceae bacterium]